MKTTTKQQSKLNVDTVESPSLEVFKGLDRLCLAWYRDRRNLQGVDLEDPQGSFQPKNFRYGLA